MHDGDTDGADDGSADGSYDGTILGAQLGVHDGDTDGADDGSADGSDDGLEEGSAYILNGDFALGKVVATLLVSDGSPLEGALLGSGDGDGSTVGLEVGRDG